jgi:hypothetical protein
MDGGMNAEILSSLRTRMASAPRPLDELHRAATAAGSPWSPDQVALLLECLPDVHVENGLYGSASEATADPVLAALVSIVTSAPIPAAALVARLPPGVVATAAALCDIARNHPDLELIPGNRIRRR